MSDHQERHVDDRDPVQGAEIPRMRWNVQLGNRVIPKSVRPRRIQENIDVFDFELADDDMDLLTDLGNNRRIRA